MATSAQSQFPPSCQTQPRFLAEATAVRSTPAWSGCIRLSRRSGKPAYTVIVSPLFEAVEMKSPVGSRAALITITNPDREHSSGLVKMLQQAFGLTPAEAQTASLMGSGLSPQDAADQLGLSVGTIRAELKAIFAKIGISRQSELASTVTRLALLAPNCGDDQGEAEQQRLGRQVGSSAALLPAVFSA